MSAALLTPPAAGDPPRKRFTRTEVERLLDRGFFEGQRCELINGDLIDKLGQKPAHAIALHLCLAWLIQLFGGERVWVQAPIEAGAPDRERSVPEPDLAVLSETARHYAGRLPNGSELLLVIEIADATARFDAGVKRDLYARAGVREYWVLDVAARRMLMHRNLAGGVYTDFIAVPEHQRIAPQAMADRSLQVSELLP